MRCVFMLASWFGMECLNEVKDIGEIEIVGAVTPKEEYVLRYGKGHSKVMKNEIFHLLSQKCRESSIPLFVMESMNTAETVCAIQEWSPELIIVAGWYHMVGKTILGIPLKGVVGLHSSLLPKYRGGAPLVWQMIHDEKNAGITLFYMDEGIDTGDIIAQRKIRIKNEDTIGTLYDKVKEEGIALLRENLPLIAIGKAARIKQVGLSEKDIFPQRNPKDGAIDWCKTSRQIYNFVRAQTKPYPGAFSYYLNYKVIIWSCQVSDRIYSTGLSGTIVGIKIKDSEEKPIVSTGESGFAVEIKEYTVLDEFNQEIRTKKGLFKTGRCFRFYC